MLNGNEHRTVGTVKLGLEQLQEEKHWFIATTESLYAIALNILGIVM